MVRERTLIFLGICITISPFVGLPYSWLSVILPIFGAITLLTALSLIRMRTKTTAPVFHEKETTLLS